MDDSLSDDEYFQLYSTKSVTANFETQLQKLSAVATVEPDPKLDLEKLTTTTMKTPTLTTELVTDTEVFCENASTKDKSNERCLIAEVLSGNSTYENERTKDTSNKMDPTDVVMISSDSDEYSCRETSGYMTRQKTRLVDAKKSQKGSKGSRRGKRRGNNHELENNIEILNVRDDAETVEDNINCEVSVKVIWKSVTIKKFQIRKFQKLSTIFDHFMMEEGLPMDKLIFTLKNVKVKPTDTPDSLNLSVVDFIEGGVLSCESIQVSDAPTPTDPVQLNNNTLIIKFQNASKEMWSLSMYKTDLMKVVMVKYAEQIDSHLDKVKFFLDGEIIDFNQTPESLGLDSGEIIDVKIVK